VELPEGGLTISDYQGGIPFPNPTEPHRGWKILADFWYRYMPHIVVNTPNNPGFNCTVDGFGNAYLLFSAAFRSNIHFGAKPHNEEAKLHKPERWQEDSTHNFGPTVIYPPSGEEAARSSARENRRPNERTTSEIKQYWDSTEPYRPSTQILIAIFGLAVGFGRLSDRSNTIPPFTGGASPA
jgi:hypothetical protein